jgi:NADH-quinone oxidoreductase subunit C
LFRLTFTFLVVLQLLRHCFTAFCCCKEKSKEPENLADKMKQNFPKDLMAQADYIKNNFAGVTVVEPIAHDNLIIYVAANEVVNFLKFLRDDQNLSFKTLLDVFGADLLGIRSPRFEVIYNLLSYKLNNRITVKVALNEGEKVATASEIFSSANWFEREAFDMYGIEFVNHPDLRRILTDYGFEGHPLRKDFPLTGYKEVRYDEQQKKVVYEPVKLMQEFRNFDFEMPWEGTHYKDKK